MRLNAIRCSIERDPLTLTKGNPEGRRYKLVPMGKPRLPMEALEFFREQGRKGGKIGAQRRVETTTPEQRKAWAKKAAAASAKVRSRRARAKRREH